MPRTGGARQAPEMAGRPGSSGKPGRSDLAPDLPTIAAIAVVAYAASDMIHEVLGHGLATALLPEVRAVSLSMVALQTQGSSRLVSAAGTFANLLAGGAALGLLRGRTGSGNARFFLWLLGALNLFNATGYLLFSGLLDVGDWAAVIAGLRPAWAWRAGLAVVGLASYVGVVLLAAGTFQRSLASPALRREHVRRLLLWSYVAGGVLFVAASCLNPISPRLIWLSGASSGFAAMAGLLFIPGIVERHGAPGAAGARPGERSRPWQVAGAAVALLFIGVLGPGIALQ